MLMRESHGGAEVKESRLSCASLLAALHDGAAEEWSGGAERGLGKKRTLLKDSSRALP